MDYIAGAKILQERFRRAQSGVFRPGQTVMQGGRSATFVRMDEGAAVIRYRGDSRTVTVSPESLSLPATA
jgi:hypothetical protein